TPPPVVEQDGWLPQPDESARPEWPAPSPIRAEPRPYRDAVTAPSGGRRGGLLAVLAGVVVIAVTSGVLLFLSRSGQPEDPPEANAASPSITVEPTLITAGTEGAPTDVRIEEDRGTSVTLAWTAPAGGPQSYVAVAYLAGSNEPLDVHTIPGGQSQMTVTFTDLDETEDYCFTIGVLYSVHEVAPATVCTAR
ncbi:MAG: fibronectin type III domain-containing protein, partial [Micromonosporaceae bacterium]|nr:fibronectin type III domain-containing protein [Micromonosporaceae bacterium]